MSRLETLTMLLWSDPDSGEGLSLKFDATTGETKDDSVDITDHPVEEGSNVVDNARDAPALLTIEAIVSETPSITDADARMTDVDLNVFDAPSRDLASVDITVKARSVPGKKTFALDIPTPPVQFSESGLVQAGIGALKGALFGAPKATAIGETHDQNTSVTATAIKASGGSSTSIGTARALQQDADRNRVRDVYDKLLLLKEQHVTLSLIQTAYRDYTDMMVARVSQPRAAGDGRSAKFQIDFKQIRIASSQVVAAPKPSETRGNTTKSLGSQGTKPASAASEEKGKSVMKSLAGGS